MATRAYTHTLTTDTSSLLHTSYQHKQHHNPISSILYEELDQVVLHLCEPETQTTRPIEQRLTMQTRQSLTNCVIALLLRQVLAAPAPQPTYSVVDVDGGANGYPSNGAPAPTTVYKTVTETGPAATVTITISASPETITISYTTTVTEHDYTQSQASTSLESALPSNPASWANTIATPWSTPSAATSTATVVETVVSELAIPPLATSTSTTYYDNGLWHTSYAIKPSSIVNVMSGSPGSSTSLETTLPSPTLSLPTPATASVTYQRQRGKRSRQRT